MLLIQYLCVHCKVRGLLIEGWKEGGESRNKLISKGTFFKLIVAGC